MMSLMDSHFSFDAKYNANVSDFPATVGSLSAKMYSQSMSEIPIKDLK